MSLKKLNQKYSLFSDFFYRTDIIAVFEAFNTALGHAGQGAASLTITAKTLQWRHLFSHDVHQICHHYPLNMLTLQTLEFSLSY